MKSFLDIYLSDNHYNQNKFPIIMIIFVFENI